MKYHARLIILFAALCLACSEKSVKLSVAPDGLYPAIQQIVAKRGEVPSQSSLKVYSHPSNDNAFFVTFSTDKADGWFLFAQRQYKERQIYWQLTNPTEEQIENFRQ